MSDRHIKRDSLTGFNRTRLRGTLRVAMGVKSNADMFASKGDTWDTTPQEKRRDALERNKLERVLATAHKEDETPYKPAPSRDPDNPVYKVVSPLAGPPTMKQQREIIAFVRDKLADDGLPMPVLVNKQRLAQEKRKERAPMSCRSSSRNALTAALAKANQLAQLDKQLRANETVKAKYSGKYRAYKHFTQIIEPLKADEYEQIMEQGQAYTIALLTYVFSVRSMKLSHVGQNKKETV